MGPYTPFAGGSETRPAGHTPVRQELAARVADGVTSVGAAMKRGTGPSQPR
jgi:methylmalonyl-CoA mutase N-terminal domain/subunit